MGNIFVDIDGTLQANNGTILTLANKSSGAASISLLKIFVFRAQHITTSVSQGRGEGH